MILGIDFLVICVEKKIDEKVCGAYRKKFVQNLPFKRCLYGKIDAQGQWQEKKFLMPRSSEKTGQKSARNFHMPSQNHSSGKTCRVGQV